MCFFVLLFKGDDAMFGDAEHYKYLTNEADLNNVGDDSIALTPKTPKREDSKLNNQQSAQQQAASSEKTPISENENYTRSQQQAQQSNYNGVTNGTNGTMANSLGNITIADSMDGSFYNGYDSNKNVNQIECDNIPVESRPKAAG